MNLSLGGDDAPLIGDKEEEEEEEDDEGNEEQQQQGGEGVQHGGPVMMDWESTRAFHMQSRQEQMTFLQAHRIREAVDHNTRMIEQLQAQLANKFHPPSYGRQ